MTEEKKESRRGKPWIKPPYVTAPNLHMLVSQVNTLWRGRVVVSIIIILSNI